MLLQDSAYIYVGGLSLELTEGDVITIFSQYGEIMDIHLPRDKDTGKKRGFGFLMYADQRSTVLAVDNLNGTTVLDRTLRVDHVKQYNQPKVRDDEGELQEAEQPSLNAAPRMIEAEAEDDDIDLEDPMAAYISSSRKKESSEDRARRKEEKRRRKEERELKRMRKERRESKGRHEHDPEHRPTSDHHRSRPRTRSRSPSPRRSSHHDRHREHRDR